MAIGLENYTNIDTSDLVNYPNGAIKDNDGSNNGTPVDRRTYNDIHQFFAFMLRQHGITANGAPESALNQQYAQGVALFIRSVFASEGFRGTAEIATQTETNTGTDDERIVTPLKLNEAVTVMGVDGATKLRTKIVNIGNWNMDATASVSVAHGLTNEKIRSVSAMIRDDSNSFFNLLHIVDASCIAQGGYGAHNTGNVVLIRLTGGTFDTVSFDDNSFNRGWITITYEA